MEYLVPKTGFFCNVCSRFFTGTKVAEINHCRTLKHYENLQVSGDGLWVGQSRLPAGEHGEDPSPRLRETNSPEWTVGLIGRMRFMEAFKVRFWIDLY